MFIEFVLPPSDQHPSGGSAFNRQLLTEARRAGFPLRPRVLRAERPNFGRWHSRAAVILWDSLFLDNLARAQPATRRPQGMLVHYLPFLDPTLGPTARRRRRWIFDHAVRRLDFLLVSGLANAGLLRRRYPAVPVSVLEPGVDPVFRRHAALPSGRADHPVPRLITVANLLPAKGVLELLEILERLAEVPFEWHLVGDGTREPRHAARVRERLGASVLRDRVIYHGRLGMVDLAALFRTMDLFVFGSRYESYGMALAEAAAAALPVVSTRVGAATKLVRHGHEGLLFDVSADRQFAEGLRHLLLAPKLRNAYRAHLLQRQVRSPQIAFQDFRRALRPWLRRAGGDRPVQV